MPSQPNKHLVLAAMIFAVAMMFIDQTIVAIAIPSLEKDLALSATGAQWIVNGYLLALAALFAFGGKLSDIVGHRRMVLIGVVGFATTSALCGATPTGDIGETWIITFRIVQGGFAALMFPAALAIVVSAYDVRERGKALAVFFAITGGLTGVGPLGGGALIELTWRAIFWVNVPVAIIAVVLTLRADPPQDRRPQPIDVRGTVLVCLGMGLLVLGFQQSSAWGWTSPVTWACIAIGALVLVAFTLLQLRIAGPLLNLRIFADRAFSANNAVLFLMSACFVPLFFFASLYAQVVLGEGAVTTGLYLLIFFAGFASASQVGGRILDARGAKPSVVLGCAVAAVGFYLWGHQMPEASVASQWVWIVVTGAGLGLVLSPVSTDALNRVASGTYGEVTGITQTVRNFGACVGLAILGTVMISQNRSNVESTLASIGMPTARAETIAAALSRSSGSVADPSLSGGGTRLFDAVRHDFALTSQTVFVVMAAVMAAAFVVAAVFMRSGLAPQVVQARAAGDLPRADDVSL